MDMMRTLLAYLAATMALTVQGADAPKETPVPTPPPAVTAADNGETPLPEADLTAVPPELLD